LDFPTPTLSGFWDQLVYAFFRFDFRFIEQNTVYKYLLNLRYHLIAALLPIFGVKKTWVESELFDKNNPRFDLDDNHRYEEEGIKYFYKENQLIYHKEEDKDESLEKFD
jgi:hypothetical protein